MSLSKKARTGIARFARVQQKPSNLKYLVSPKTIVDLAVKAYMKFKKEQV